MKMFLALQSPLRSRHVSSIEEALAILRNLNKDNKGKIRPIRGFPEKEIGYSLSVYCPRRGWYEIMTNLNILNILGVNYGR